MHLFEFMDLEWLPTSLRLTLRDILECGNSRPFRPYYEWVAQEVVELAHMHGCKTVVELGAGTAPITRHLLRNPGAKELKLIVCDLNPDRERYLALENSSHGRVKPIYSCVNFAAPQEWPDDALLVLSATLHHIPSNQRMDVIEVLTAGGRPIAVFEPLRRNLNSMLFTFLSLVPSLLTPLRFCNEPGMFRRVVWCWLPPLAPLLFCWDGVVSCLREWSLRDWEGAICGKNLSMNLAESSFCQSVVIAHKKPGPSRKLAPANCESIFKPLSFEHVGHELT